MRTSTVLLVAAVHLFLPDAVQGLARWSGLLGANAPVTTALTEMIKVTGFQRGLNHTRCLFSSCLRFGVLPLGLWFFL